MAKRSGRETYEHHTKTAVCRAPFRGRIVRIDLYSHAAWWLRVCTLVFVRNSVNVGRPLDVTATSTAKRARERRVCSTTSSVVVATNEPHLTAQRRRAADSHG